MTQTTEKRRTFLSLCTGALLALLAALIGGPAVAFVTSPMRKGGSNPQKEGYADAGPLDAIPIGKWTSIPIEIVRQDGWDQRKQSRAVWVLRSAGGDVKTLSPICPHLGCPIAWIAQSNQFMCPCHGGTFSAGGEHISGPPPRNMDELKSQTHDGHLWVLWQDFQSSVSDKVPVQT